MPQPINPTAAKKLINQLLDRGYTDTTRHVMNAIAAYSNGGIMQTRLRQLDDEIARLTAKGEKLAADNPVLRATIADFEAVLAKQATLIDAVSPSIQQNGIEAAARLTKELALPGVTPAQLHAMGIQWNVPNPEAVTRTVSYTTQPAWDEALSTFKVGIADRASQIAIHGIIAGQNPLQTAYELRNTIEGVPLHQANVLMRTLQLNSYREADMMQRIANEAILEGQIRIAVLDARTCVACIALHGKELPINMRIDDHWFGRCYSVSIVKGRKRSVESGADWLARQDDDLKRKVMSIEGAKAYAAGKVKLSDFVGSHHDNLFGNMIDKRSWKDIQQGINQ